MILSPHIKYIWPMVVPTHTNFQSTLIGIISVILIQDTCMDKEATQGMHVFIGFSLLFRVFIGHMYYVSTW